MPDEAHRHSRFRHARADIERGDFYKAHCGVAGLACIGPYDADVLAETGDLANQIGDSYSAGLYWLVSSASGDDVEKVIQEFVQRVGPEPAKIVAHLPGNLRLSNLAEYPDFVRQRLERVGLADAIIVDRGPAQTGLRRMWSRRIVPLLLVAVWLLLISSCTVGMIDIAFWSAGQSLGLK